MGLRSIARFYYPLAISSILSLGVLAFVTFFLGLSNMTVESLAVLPVVSSLEFGSMGLSYQEVKIALKGLSNLYLTPKQVAAVRRWGNVKR